MLPNRQKIYNVVSAHLHGREFSRRELLSLIDQHYPGTNPGSILPSDYLSQDALKSDPSNDGNRGNYLLYPRFLARTGRDRYKFVGWDGRDGGSLSAPAIQSAGAQLHSPAPVFRPPIAARPIVLPSHERGGDHSKLVSALGHLAPFIRPSSDRAWQREPALRVIDCVLSLRRRYDAFLVPRLDRFEREHPGVRTVPDLQALIATYQSPDVFVSGALDYRHAERAATLHGVVNWLATVSGSGAYTEQLANLERWAKEARPRDCMALRIAGFGMAGFQYLRMLFGANTTKPDVHICRFVADCVGHPVSDVGALQLLENAASETGVLLRDLDTTIWEKSARA